MSDGVKPRRRYHAPRRQEQAQRTRRSILDAAQSLLEERGYAGTTMAAVGERAGVSLETVYAVVGTKPLLVRLLVETAISGVDNPVEAAQRDYVRSIRAEPDAANKLAIYAAAMRRIQARLAPLFRMVQAAAPAHRELGALWTEIAGRRSANMHALARELAATGQLRDGVTVDEVADVIWATNSSEFYVLLVHDRGWSPEKYERWLADAWKRLLLRDI